MSQPPIFDQTAFLTGMNPAYIPPGFDGAFRQPFVYTINFINIAGAGAVVTNTANIQNDSYFVVVQQCADIKDNATGLVDVQPNVAPVLVNLFDSSSGKTLSDQPVPIGAWFGNVFMPYLWLARAQVFRPGGQIQATVTNNLAAAQNIRLSFIGFKVYPKVPDDFSQM